MSTPFSNIYNRFLIKIVDYDLTTYDKEIADATLLQYLKNATALFVECEKDLQIDETNQVILADLSTIEEEILAMYMLIAWYDKFINSYEGLRMYLTDIDFKMSSQANLLKEKKEYRKDIIEDLEKLINKYLSYSDDLGFLG